MIRERVNAGLARAREQGKTLGRPRLDRNTEKAIRKALRKGGTGMRKIDIKFEVATGTVQRIKAELVA
jgi:DNA invertase Pin-like site-specific DNA recombinase